MRIAAALGLLLVLAACADPATMFAAGTRSWCKSAPNCTVQDGN
jgi:hypothetical protein